MRLATLLLLSMLLCMTCKKDDPPKEGNCMTAVIDGEEFTAESTTGTFVIIDVDYNNLGSQETKLLTINGTIPSLTSNTETITLTFACSEFTSDLDYVDTDAGCGIAMNYQLVSFSNPNGAIAVVPTTGVISVQEVSDERIKGTFSFTGDDQNGTTYEITNGFFDTTIN